MVFQLSENINANKIFLVKSSELEGRLDPFYYIPEISELEKRVRKKSTTKLRDYILGIASGATPSIEEEEKYYSTAANGTAFIRVQNLTPTNELVLNDLKYINKETHEGYLKRSQIAENDLLVKITGVGRMAVSSVPPKGFTGNSNQHLVVIKTENRETSEVLATFLNTDVGEKLASRRSTGGTRPALDYAALKSIPIIFKPEIVSLVKAAVSYKQSKETEAQRLLATIDNYALKELGISVPIEDNRLENRIFYTNLSETSGGRFDPKGYLTYYKALRQNIKEGKFQTVTLNNLVTHSVSGEWGLDESEVENRDLYKECLVIRATEFDNVFNFDFDGSRVKYRYIHIDKLKHLDIQTGDLLIEKSGGSDIQPVGRVGIIKEEYLKQYQLAFSNFIHKIRINHKKVIPEYLFCYLRTIHNVKLTDAMQSQTSGIRNLIMGEYFNQTIPLPSLDIQEEIAQQIQQIRNEAKRLQDEALEQFERTKKEVEKIILDDVQNEPMN